MGRSPQQPQVCFTPFPADFKDNLTTVYEAIEESDFLAIDGEFSGTVAPVSCSGAVGDVRGVPGAPVCSGSGSQCWLERVKATTKLLNQLLYV